MRYLAIFIWHGDDGATWSDEFPYLDKDVMIRGLLHKGAHHSLESAEILVLENGSPNERIGTDGRPSFGHNPPKVVAHWSALNGDF